MYGGGELCFGGWVWWQNLNLIRMGVGMLDEQWLLDNITIDVWDEMSMLF